MDDEKLRNKLNEMFDIEGAQIEKKQGNKLARWLFILHMTAFALGVAAFCVWGARFSHGAMKVAICIIIGVALAYVLFRLWLVFIVDVLSGNHAETVFFLRRGDDRYYYTVGRHIRKFEYSRGYIAVSGSSYDKFEDKTDFSPLAGRYNKSLQRRSSLYTTMAPSFWYNLIIGGEYTIGEREIKANGRGYDVTLEWDDFGKIRRIDYYGDGYYLYDSASPIKIMDCKLPGKYTITYDFTVGAQPPIKLEPVFGVAMDDFLMLPPSPDCAVVLHDSDARFAEETNMATHISNDVENAEHSSLSEDDEENNQE